MNELLPRPTTQFRRRAWREFQRALDPLAPPKPLPGALISDRLGLPQHLEALEQARRDLRPGQREADWLKGLSRLETESLGKLTQRRLDRRRVKGLHFRQHVGRSREHGTIFERPLGRHSLEEEAGEARKLAQRRDLLL